MRSLKLETKLTQFCKELKTEPDRQMWSAQKTFGLYISRCNDKENDKDNDKDKDKIAEINN